MSMVMSSWCCKAEQHKHCQERKGDHTWRKCVVNWTITAITAFPFSCPFPFRPLITAVCLRERFVLFIRCRHYRLPHTHISFLQFSYTFLLSFSYLYALINCFPSNYHTATLCTVVPLQTGTAQSKPISFSLCTKAAIHQRIKHSGK